MCLYFAKTLVVWLWRICPLQRVELEISGTGGLDPVATTGIAARVEAADGLGKIIGDRDYDQPKYDMQ
jgi:hypothetical protein